MRRNKLKLFIAAFVAFLISCVISIYVRTYALRESTYVPAAARAVAEKMVQTSLRNQVMAILSVKSENLPESLRLRLAEKQVENLIKTDRPRYEQAVNQMLSEMRQSQNPQQSRHYLLEADPYYYYYISSILAEQGKFTAEFKDGMYFNRLRGAPHGRWTYFYLNSYVGYYFYRILEFFLPHIELMEALGYVSLVLTVVALALFFILCYSLDVGLFSAFLGSIIFGLAPVFIQRSAYGWYDSDPYNYIFPFAVLSLYFWSTKRNRFVYASGIIAGFLTALFAMFWQGWPFIFVLVLVAGITSGILGVLLRKKEGQGYPKFSVSFFVTCLLFGLIFLTPKRLADNFFQGFSFLGQFNPSELEVWPNLFLTVGETRSIQLIKLVYLSGNMITFSVSILGVIWYLIWSLRSRNFHSFSRWTTLMILLIPLTVMSLQTERFALLFVIPYALFLTMAVEGINDVFEKLVLLINQFRKIQEGFKKTLIRIVPAVIAMIVLLPMTLIEGHIVGLRIKPIMNDAWYAMMMEIKEKTPKDAIIDCWWPPGHFISGLAKRRVLFDGASQQVPEAYWLAKAYLANDERVSAGILRMLDVSGNDSVDYLKKVGFDLPMSIDIVTSLLPLSREQAFGVFQEKMSAEQKNNLLDLIYGSKQLPPGYLLIYDDLMKQNLALTMVAKWDFRKALEMKTQGRNKTTAENKKSNITDPYVRQVMEIIGGIWKYTPESRLKERKGNLFFFDNGLRIDIPTKEAFIEQPEKKLKGKPLSLFYLEGNQLIEKQYLDGNVDVSALLIEQNGEYSCVMANRELIRSMLFRLYYLNGEGLDYFKPFLKQSDDKTKTYLYLFQVDYNLLKKADGQ